MTNPIENTHYIILSVKNRTYDFSHPAVASFIMEELDFRRNAGNELDLHLCLVLPKELHILLTLTPEYGKPIKNFVTAYKRYISRNISITDDITMKWTPGFEHREITDEAAFEECTKEIMNIPLEQKLIPRIGGLPYILTVKS